VGLALPGLLAGEPASAALAAEPCLAVAARRVGRQAVRPKADAASLRAGVQSVPLGLEKGEAVRAGEEWELPALLRTRFQVSLHALAAGEVGELPVQAEDRALRKAVEPPDCSLTQAVLKARQESLEQRAVLETQELPDCQALRALEAYSAAMAAVGR
jgi:hypothetical protein